MNLQKAGIQHARDCFNAEMGLTKDTLDAINKVFERYAVPMLYNREPFPPKEFVPTEISSISHQLKKHEFVVFSHARIYWIRDPSLSEIEFLQLSKNSDWLLRGFSQFVGEYGCDAVLVLVEYGPDVQAAKVLSTELGIAHKVIWLPVLKRREIMYLLQNIDVGVGEFYVTPGTIWGGTGWEVLASGKPFLQAFNFTAENYIEQFGHPPPPILHADSPEAVAMQLGRMWSAPDERARIGRENAAWFNENNGISLARKWLTRMGALSNSKADL